jgi:hypothetical protein
MYIFCIVPRGREVGLDDSVGYNEVNLSRRKQSSTLNAHRLVYYIAKVCQPMSPPIIPSSLLMVYFSVFLWQEYSLEASERVYDELNRRHFTEGGILNDKTLLLDTVELILGSEEMSKCGDFLESSRGVEAVMRTVDAVHDLGVHSIPTLIIDGGRTVMSGAERADSVADALRQVNGCTDCECNESALWLIKECVCRL